jgi:hypothetical protein
VAYQVSGPRTAQAAPEAKPPGELEALKKENELLKFNLQVVLEKARALESDVRALKEQVKTAKASNNTGFNPAPNNVVGDVLTFPSQDLINFYVTYDTFSSAHQGAVQQAEAALKALREAKSPEARRRAADALEQAVKKLKEPPTKPGKPQGGK